MSYNDTPRADNGGVCGHESRGGQEADMGPDMRADTGGTSGRGGLRADPDLTRGPCTKNFTLLL